jgi:cyanate permease
MAVAVPDRDHSVVGAGRLYGVIFWIPQIFARAGIAAANVGNAVAIPFAVAAIGMVWWSRRSDRMKERVWHIAAASLTACLGLAASAFWIKNATGSFTWGLLAVAGSVLMTGIIALLLGHDSAAEHGDAAAPCGVAAPGRNSAHKPVGRAA